MSGTIQDIIREMRSVGDYPMYRKPVFSAPEFVSTSYIKDFKCPEGLYFGETAFVEDPRVVEVNVYELAARIEAAANGLRTENEMLKDEIKCKTQNYEDVIRAKDQELERLRAALKPVLKLEDNYDGHWPFASLAVDAVKEAQRIYKEVAK